MNNIIAAVDFSEHVDRVVEKAFEMANSFNAKLWIVHVATPDPEFVDFKTGPQYIRNTRAGLLRKEHKDLQAFSETYRNKGIDCEALLVEGRTSATLLDEIDRLSADMVVIGSHHNSSIFDFMVGSVQQEISKRATVPVLLVPLDD